MGNDLIGTPLHPKIADAVPQIITEAKARGINVGLFSGARSIADQDKLYALGRTVSNPDGRSEANPMGNVITKSMGGYSWHNYGLAGDVVPKDEKGNWTWDRTAAEWEEIGKIGEIFGLVWGGRWKRFPDFPHFEYVGKLKNYSFPTLKEMALSKGIEAIWSLI